MVVIPKLPKSIQTFKALSYRNFRWYWFATLGLSVGQGIQQFTIIWLILDLTGSTSKLGLVLFLQGFPMLAFVILGGVAADKFERLKILTLGQAIIALYVALIATLVITGQIHIWHLYIGAVLVGIVQAFNSPIRMALVKDLVAKEHIMNGISLNSMMTNLTFLIGQPVAGFTIALFGIGPALFISAGFFGAGVITLLFISAPTKTATSGKSRLGADILDGWRYVRTTPAILALVLLGIFWGLLGQSSLSLVPAFAKEVMGFNSKTAAFVTMAIGLGAFSGNLFVASSGNFRYKNWLMLGGITILSTALLGFSLSHTFPLMFLFLFFGGMGSFAFTQVGNAWVQLVAPPLLVGRVMSIWFLSAGCVFVGGLLMGFLGESFGLRTAFIWASGFFICLVLFLGYVWPTFRQMPPE